MSGIAMQRKSWTDREEEKCKKGGIIATTNAIINPRAMVVATFDAIITQFTVA